MALQVTVTISKSMKNDDEIIDSLHDKIVKAFIRYSIAAEKFDVYGFATSEVEAREALLEIHKLSKERRVELRQQRRAKHGDRRKGIVPTDPTERRQRKLDRARQKQEAQKASGTN